MIITQLSWIIFICLPTFLGWGNKNEDVALCHIFTLKCFNTSWMASCHAWNQPSGNVAVEKKYLWGVVSKRAVAMVMQWQTGREGWMLVSMGHRTSDRVWSSQGCNERREVWRRAGWRASALRLHVGIFTGPPSLKSPYIVLFKTQARVAFTEQRFYRLLFICRWVRLIVAAPNS